MALDDTRLRMLYAKSAFAKAILDHFADRQNNATETTIDTMIAVLERQGAQPSRPQIVEVFRDLGAAGAGEFIVGRKKHPSRFHWLEDSSSVGKRARVTPSNSKEQVLPVQGHPERSSAARDLIEHPFLLRPGLPLSFALPADLTQVEAARLADFIKALPFER
jgi:hypothetical protein